jgi:hypothetical protein
MLLNVINDDSLYVSVTEVQGKNIAYHNINKVQNQGIYE